MKSISYKTSAFLLLGAALSLPILAQAKEIPLYQEPKEGAPSTAKADLSVGVIPIFTSKDGNWVKIGDPRNGNVGWIKASELSGNNETSVIFSNHISSGGDNNSKNYVFQFGTPQKLTPQQEKVLQHIQEEQAASRKAMQKAIQDMMNNWNMPGPILMPIIVVPQSAAKPPSTPTKPVNEAPKKAN